MEYEVKIMMEYWVTVKAECSKDAEEKAYLEYDEWLHTGTLYSADAYPVRQDLDEDEDSE